MAHVPCNTRYATPFVDVVFLRFCCVMKVIVVEEVADRVVDAK